jgi:hypothetical protein
MFRTEYRGHQPHIPQSSDLTRHQMSPLQSVLEGCRTDGKGLCSSVHSMHSTSAIIMQLVDSVVMATYNDVNGEHPTGGP